MDFIRVKDIACYSHHGCMAEEAKIGQQYSVDVEIATNFSEAAKTDDLSQTIDYCDINRIVVEEMAIRSKLIEHVAQRILHRFKKELSGLHSAEIEIKKINKFASGINLSLVNIFTLIQHCCSINSISPRTFKKLCCFLKDFSPFFDRCL